VTIQFFEFIPFVTKIIKMSEFKNIKKYIYYRVTFAIVKAFYNWFILLLLIEHWNPCYRCHQSRQHHLLGIISKRSQFQPRAELDQNLGGGGGGISAYISHTRECHNHTRECHNHTHTCQNHTLRVEITIVRVESWVLLSYTCVSKSQCM
jgi:hypothetical protein